MSKPYRVLRDAAGDLHAIVTVGGTNVVDLDLGPVADDADLTVALTWEPGRIAAALNGDYIEDASYSGPLPTVTTIREGSGPAGDEWFGTIARAALYGVSAAQGWLEEATA